MKPDCGPDLDISVHEVPFVHVLQAQSHLGEDSPGLDLGEAIDPLIDAAHEMEEEVPPRKEFRDEEDSCVILRDTSSGHHTQSHTHQHSEDDEGGVEQ